MGESVENVYYGPHAAGGTATGCRLAIHKVSGSVWIELGDVNANEHAALQSAARSAVAAY